MTNDLARARFHRAFQKFHQKEASPVEVKTRTGSFLEQIKERVTRAKNANNSSKNGENPPSPSEPSRDSINDLRI